MKNKSLKDKVFIGSIPKNIVFQAKTGEKKIVEAREGGYKLLRVKHVKEAIKKEREDLRKIIWEIAKDFGGSILHYNEVIDDIHIKRFGKFK